ncbi:MAG: TolC family protein [Sphingobacteriales bacterium]|jgi:outer membrane protein TolC
MKIKFLLVLFAAPLALQAQQDSTVLNAQEAVRIALEKNLNIKIVQEDLTIAKINNTWGNAGRWPTITAFIQNTEALTNLDQQLSNGTNIKRNGVTNNILNGNLTAQWRIYNGQRVVASKRRFEELEKIGQINVEAQMQQISFDVLVTYYNIVRLNQQVKAFSGIIALAEERLKIAQTRFEVGSAAKTDMLQSAIDLNGQQNSLVDIKRQIQNNKAILNTLLLRPANQELTVADSVFTIPVMNYEEEIAKIDTQNLNLLRIQRERALLVEDRRIINSQRLPIFSVNSVTNFNRNKSSAGLFLVNSSYGPNIGVSLAVPIYNSNIFKTQLRVNEVQQKQQYMQQELLKTQVQRDLLIAFQEYQTAIRIAEMEQKNVKNAEENNFIATERFKKLQGNTIELRQAQLSLIEAQDRYINAVFRSKIAALSIDLLTGEVKPD